MDNVAHKDFASTYSIVARDPETGQIGAAVQTHQVGVGRVVIWTQPGYGALVTQSLVNISYGPLGLSLLREGIPADQVVKALTATDANAFRRQVAVVTTSGEVAAFTGSGCIAEAGHYTGKGFSVQANMMLTDNVIESMRRAYESTRGEFVVRLLAALKAAQKAGGDIRGMQSAALKIVPGNRDSASWEAVFDVRVDEAQDPLAELERLVTIRRAQLLDSRGHELLAKGKLTDALQTWKQAREMAPSISEMAFWQAISLADSRPDAQSVSLAARILDLALESVDDPDHAPVDVQPTGGDIGRHQHPGAAALEHGFGPGVRALEQPDQRRLQDATIGDQRHDPGNSQSIKNRHGPPASGHPQEYFPAPAGFQILQRKPIAFPQDIVISKADHAHEVLVQGTRRHPDLIGPIDESSNGTNIFLGMIQLQFHRGRRFQALEELDRQGR